MSHFGQIQTDEPKLALLLQLIAGNDLIFSRARYRVLSQVLGKLYNNELVAL
jgi:hypothetical protein